MQYFINSKKLFPFAYFHKNTDVHSSSLMLSFLFSQITQHFNMKIIIYLYLKKSQKLEFLSVAAAYPEKDLSTRKNILLAGYRL
jgi:hypothetical protein